jgi:hypothetical protein
MISRPDDADTLKPVPEPWSSARPRLGAFLGVLTTFGKRPPGALAQ